MSDFAENVAKLVAGEMTLAKGNPDRMASMIERLAAMLGFTVALAAEGDPRTIDTLLAEADAQAHEEAVARAPIGRRLGELRKAQS